MYHIISDTAEHFTDDKVKAELVYQDYCDTFGKAALYEELWITPNESDKPNQIILLKSLNK